MHYVKTRAKSYVLIGFSQENAISVNPDFNFCLILNDEEENIRERVELRNTFGRSQQEKNTQRRICREEYAEKNMQRRICREEYAEKSK